MSEAQMPRYPIRGASGGPEPDYQKLVQQAIVQDPQIEDSANVSATIKGGGLFRRKKLHLIGTVGSERQKQRAQELAESNTGAKLGIVNEIVVK